LRTAFAVTIVALLAMPVVVASAPDSHRDSKPTNKGQGKRTERSVPEPATVLLLGAAAGVAYGVRKLRSKRR
jgi:hypothetical protein